MREKPLRSAERDALRDRLGALDPDHVGARHHHLARERVAELEDRRDHVALAALHDAALLGEVDQIAQLGFGRERAFAIAAARGDRVAEQDQQLRQRAEDRGSARS